MIPDSIWNGEVRAEDYDALDRRVCRIVAQGRIIKRFDDRGPRDYRVNVAIVEHPELPAPEVFALFWMGCGPLRAYRTTEADARTALADHGAFNLA